MGKAAQNFYLFLGFHSFLLGLFPFFLPVYLYKNGAGLDEISWFIAITGLAFSCTLFCLDYLRSSSYLWPLLLSFLLELVLLALLVMEAPLALVAIVNGSYSCLYWTLQRILFLSGGSEKNSGKRFGNFQIYILIVLKIGILGGSLLLENSGIASVCVVSTVISSIGVVYFLRARGDLLFPQTLNKQEPMNLLRLLRFNDRYNSRLIFAFDGVFLYLESYFWVISIFLMVGESFVKLGGVVIVLAVILGAIFFIIKNRIDRIDKQLVYQIGVGLYMFSWLLRAMFEASFGQVTQIAMLLIIAFCTSFFRLTFNKRFFDLAGKNGDNRYIFIKSHYSQIFIAVGFTILGCGLGLFSDNLSFLRNIYLGASVFAFLYLLYKHDDHVKADRFL
ncbi:hypothetical protein [Desulforhopalus sp. 52FAK]